MAEKYLFFNSTQDDTREYQANDIADYWNSFLSTGLISDNGEPQLKVVAEGTNRIIEIQKGRALIDGHLYLNDSTKLKIEEPDALYDRIDRVVIRYDNTIKNRFIKAFVLRGETSENPIPPQLTRGGDIYELSLAQIRVVGGKSFIEQKDIVDERLKEDVCGLASSLVSVPTSIFNESFKEYMDKIAMEWQDWYNSVERDTYVTNTQFDAHNRQLDRQLANLNAIADIDEKAIGNTGKFYDLFDGTNDKSIARADTTAHVIIQAIDADQTIISLNEPVRFNIGDEVSFFGLQTSSDTIPTLVNRTITDINELDFIIDEPLNISLISGSNVCRSTVNNKGELTGKMNYISWLEPKLQQNATGVTIARSSDIIQASDSDTFFYFNTYFYSESSPVTYRYIGVDLASKTYKDARGIPTNIVWCKGQLYGLSNNVLYKVDATSKGMTLTSILEIPDAKLIQVMNDELYAVTLHSGTSSYYYYFKIFKIDLANQTAELITDGPLNNTIYVSESIAPTIRGIDKDFNVWCTTYQSYTNHIRVQYRKVDGKYDSAFLSDTYKVEPSVMKFTCDGYVIAYRNQSQVFYGISELYLLDSTNNAKIVAINDISPPNTSGGSGTNLYPNVSSDGMFLVSPKYSLTGFILYGIKRNFNGHLSLDLIYDENGTSLTNSATLGFCINSNTLVYSKYEGTTYSSEGSTNFQTYTGIAEIESNEKVVRYNFLKPVKNLAGWLFAKETPTAVKAELSLVNQDENENFKELTVTQIENEYEFLETENLYPKDKATLKLTIEGGSLDKLLGGIE